MTRRALLLINPKARAGRDAAAAECLRKAALDVVEESAPPHSIASVIARFRDRVDLVVIGGGDGSLNAAAAGLVESKLPLGILPLGTANDLARTLELPTDLAAACAVIAAGRTRTIDLGQANDRYFFNVASIGLSVEIAKSLDRETKKFWGKLAYAKTACSVAMTAQPFSAEIRSAQGDVRVRTLQIAVGNGRFYGGGMSVAADAAIDDQRLDLYSLECRRWWRLFWLAPAIWLGQHGRGRDVRTMAGDAFEIRTKHPLPVNADGEIVTRTPVTFRVIPKAIEVFVPTK